MLNEGPLCLSCPNRCSGQRRVEHDGTGSSGILLVGESPWKDEVRRGKPFSGAAGAMLDRWIRRLGLERQQFLISNAMWCAPPRLGWFQTRDAWDAINHCAPYLDRLIAERKPKVIVALGGTAMQRLLGVTGLETRQAYVHDSSYGIPVIPTYHPSYVMQGQHKLTNAVLFAFRRAIDIAQHGLVQEPVEYLLDPQMEELVSFMAAFDPAMPLAFDIETPYSSRLNEDEEDEGKDDSYQILRVSLSFRERTGVSLPWAEPYIGFVHALLERAQRVIFWNGSFDIPRLRANGVTFGGIQEDAMWAWHWLQSDLPKSLGFVAPFYTDLPPWKHLSDSEPARYSAMDADATLRCYNGIRADLEQQGRWRQFERHCTEVTPLLNEMGGMGLLIDEVRQQDFKAKLEAQLEAAKLDLQTMVPLPVFPVKLYKRKPADCETTEVTVEGEVRYEKKLPFNPDSPQQVKSLIAHFGLEVPKNRKTGGDSTGAKFLERFAKKHEVFRAILDCRQRADMLGTFIWPANAAGRVTTQYGFHPSTWRKSSRQVNLQNIPKRAELAKTFRRMLVASPGHVLIEADGSAIEAVLVGYAAGDADYIRLAKAGIHDFLTAHQVGKPIAHSTPLETLVPYLKAIKREYKREREVSKRVVHSGNYLISAFGLHDEYAEYFPSTKDAQAKLDFYFGLFPKIKAWQRNTLERAHREGFLDNHFQYRHYFFNVFTWNDYQQDWSNGTDAKRAIAFGPQSDASAIQTEVLLRLAQDAFIRSCLRLIIHDSVVLEVPRAYAEEVATKVYEAMTAPIPQLGGLSIGAEVQVGESLGDMEVYEIGGTTSATNLTTGHPQPSHPAPETSPACAAQPV